MFLIQLVTHRGCEKVKRADVIIYKLLAEPPTGNEAEADILALTGNICQPADEGGIMVRCFLETLVPHSEDAWHVQKLLDKGLGEWPVIITVIGESILRQGNTTSDTKRPTVISFIFQNENIKPLLIQERPFCCV